MRKDFCLTTEPLYIDGSVVGRESASNPTKNNKIRNNQPLSFNNPPLSGNNHPLSCNNPGDGILMTKCPTVSLLYKA